MQTKTGAQKTTVSKNVLSPYHQLSPSLLTSTRTRQLYEKKIMPGRNGWNNNIESSLS